MLFAAGFGTRMGALTASRPKPLIPVAGRPLIDHAIALGLSRVEAGAQGEHKLARGYLPSAIHSAHWIADPGLRKAVARFLDAERVATDEEIEILTAYGPFRRGPADLAQDPQD